MARPPIAKKHQNKSVTHGHERIDEYSWLRDDNWQQVMLEPEALDSKIREYLEAENAYQEVWMADTDKLQKELFAEIRGRIKEDDSSVPMKDGDWAYGVSYVEGAQQPRFVREPTSGGKTQVILDGDLQAQGKEYFRLGSCSHSPDHSMLAWAVDDKGSEYFEITIRDLETGEDRQQTIDKTAGGCVWSADSSHVFFTRLDANHRPSQLYYRDLDSGNETLLYEEEDSGFFMGVGKTQSGDWIIIDIHDHETSEAWLLPANEPDAKPQLVSKRDTGIEYSIDEGNGTLFILTNQDDAKDFKIMTSPAVTPQPENWKDIIPHEDGRLILSHEVFARHLVWLERREGLPRIVIHRLSDGHEHAIDFDEEAYSLGLGGAYEFDTDVIRFTYSSMTTPSQTFDYNMETQERTLLKTQEVPSGHEATNYITRRVMANAHDGETVPVSLIYHKDTKLDGSAPCLLYGYGSYGVTIPASFNTNILSMVDRGFVYAIAHIRGGKDKGFRWYELGRREHKKNTFRDFLSAAHHLIAEGFTAKGKIVAHGGSAGGMLMGAISNIEPDLFAGIIAEVPFVDVMNTMLDNTLPLTPPEWPEWGNPIESKKAYDYMLSYSPYDQVSKQDYPTILAIGGLTDPRVTYWEPAKWVAKLREYNASQNAILLKTNMGAGHGGASGRFSRLEEVAFNYAFALKVSGKQN